MQIEVPLVTLTLGSFGMADDGLEYHFEAHKKPMESCLKNCNPV